MPDPASVVVIVDAEALVFTERRGAEHLLYDLYVVGPERLLERLVSRKGWEEDKKPYPGEAGAIMDAVRRHVKFYALALGGETGPVRDKVLQKLGERWSPWTFSWAHAGVADLQQTARLKAASSETGEVGISPDSRHMSEPEVQARVNWLWRRLGFQDIDESVGGLLNPNDFR